ncbi:MAG: hypothetical protein LBH75_04630 [Treponema sp.]|jgi:hypothetical protein|nr:hypothetical protein [Treponema sp.]
MAVITYSIKGKADTKPMEKTKKEMKGLFDQTKKLDNIMEGFTGIKVFASMFNKVKDCMKAYDEFASATKKELPIKKQFAEIERTFSATLGTVRDALITSFTSAEDKMNGISGKLSDIATSLIPKIGAGIGAAFLTGKEIVEAIAENFNNLSKAENWGPLLDGLAIGFLKIVDGIKELFKSLFSIYLLNLWKAWASIVGQGIYGLGELISRYILRNDELADKLKGYREKLKEHTIEAAEQALQGVLAGFRGYAQGVIDGLGDIGGGLFNSLTGGFDVKDTFSKHNADILTEINNNIAGMRALSESDDSKDSKDKTVAPTTIFAEVYQGIAEMEKSAESLSDKISVKINDVFSNLFSSLGQIGSTINSFRTRADAEKSAQKELKDLYVDYYNQAARLETERMNTLNQAEADRINAINKLDTAMANGTESAESYANKLADINNKYDLAAEAAQNKYNQDSENNESSYTKGKQDVNDNLALSQIQPGLDIITTIVSGVLNAFTSLESVSKVLNAVSTVAASIVQVLAPLIDSIFIPIGAALESIGRIIGLVLAPALTLVNAVLTPIMEVVILVLDVLEPIIGVFSTLAGLLIEMNPLIKIFSIALNTVGAVIKFIYNYILVPVVNFFVKIFLTAYNFVVGIWNEIVNFLNGISIFGWHPFNLSKGEKLDEDNYLLQTIPDQGSGDDDETFNNSASYNVQGDLYININYYNSYVNGDAELIAVSLWAEIRRAQAMGRA